jgi:hypothetical protein
LSSKGNGAMMRALENKSFFVSSTSRRAVKRCSRDP